MQGPRARDVLRAAADDDDVGDAALPFRAAREVSNDVSYQDWLTSPLESDAAVPRGA